MSHLKCSRTQVATLGEGPRVLRCSCALTALPSAAPDGYYFPLDELHLLDTSLCPNRHTSRLILRGYLMPVFTFLQCSKTVVSDPEAKPESTKRILGAEIM